MKKKNNKDYMKAFTIDNLKTNLLNGYSFILLRIEYINF